MGRKQMQSRVCSKFSSKLQLACAAAPVLSALAGNLLIGSGDVRGSAYWSGGNGNWNDNTWVLDTGNTVPPGHDSVAAAQAGPVIVGIGNNAIVTFSGASGPNVTVAGDIGMRSLYIGYAAGSNYRPNPGSGTLTLTSNAINTSQDMVWGDGASGVLNVGGTGILAIGGDATKHTVVGASADFIVNLTAGGEIWTSRYGFENGGAAYSTLNMSGGNFEFKTSTAFPTTALIDNVANTINVDDFNFSGGTLGGALGTGGGISTVTIQHVSGAGSIAYRKATTSIVTFDLTQNSTWAGVMAPGGNSTATVGDGTLVKQGVGDLTLTAVQGFHREIRPAGGLLTLNYAGHGTGMLDDNASISMSGGTLRLLGDAGGTTESIGADTARNALRATTGGSNLIIEPNGNTFTLTATNDIGRTVGGVANVSPGSGTLGTNVLINITSAGTNGVIKGWTVNNGTEFATNTGGVLVPFNSYTADTNLGATPSNSVGTIKPSGTQFAVTAPATFNGINLTGTVGITMTGAGSLELSSGSLIGNTTGSITGGTISVRAPVTAPTAPTPTDLIIHTPADLTISSAIVSNSDPINSPVALTKAGSATLTISGTNTYTDATYVDGGTLKLGSAGALPSTTAVTISNTPGAILDLNGNAVSITGLSGGGPNGGEVKLTGANLTLNNATINTYSGTLTGSGGLTKSGSFDVTLAGSNSTYTGATTITSGVLLAAGFANGGQPSSIGAASTAASNLVIDGATLRSATRVPTSTNRLFTVGANGATLFGGGNNVANVGTFGPLRFTNTGAIAFSGTSSLRTLTLASGTTGPSNGNGRERASVAMENLLTPVVGDGTGGPTQIVKNGIGVWYLAGLNTYTGATTINTETTGGLIDQPSVLRVNTLPNGGQPSSIGASSSVAGNLLLNGNASFPVQLQYVGAGNTTDREFTANGLAQIDASGTGPLVFNSTANVTGAPTTLTFTGTNSGANTLKMGIPGSTNVAKTGPGTWVLTGNLGYTGTTTVTGPLDQFGGTLRLETNLLNTSAVTSTSSTLLLAANGSLVASRIIHTGTVNATGGKIDLGDGKLIATGTPAGTWTGGTTNTYSGVTGMVAQGRNGSAAPLWDGAVGIVTSQTLATSGNLTSIGVATASDVRPDTATATALWGGQTINGTDTLVMYTYGGDATLDGKLNIDDYVKIDSGIAAGLTGWANGDFNYDGKVNIDDYTTIIDANIGNQNGIVFPTAGGIGDGGGSGVTAVPEPVGAISILGLGVTGLLRRRSRRRN